MRRLLLLFVITVALQSQVAAYSDLDPQVVASLAQWIQGKSPPASAQAKWALQLERQIAHSDWAAALRTARQLQPFAKESPATWRIAQAVLYLFNTQPERAIRELEAVFKAIPVVKHSRGSMDRQTAAYLMARAKAEQGQYADAIGWMNRAPREYRDFCGVWADAVRQWDQDVIAVWATSRSGDEQAIPALERVVSRGDAAPKATRNPRMQVEWEAARRSAVDAALILGEIHLRHGRGEKARFFLKKAGRGDKGEAVIARAHLRQMTNIRST